MSTHPPTSPNPDEDARRRLAAETLARVNRDAETVGGSSMARAAGRADGEPEDAMDIWGRRIGRGLAVVAAVAMAIHLLRTYLM